MSPLHRFVSRLMECAVKQQPLEISDLPEGSREEIGRLAIHHKLEGVLNHSSPEMAAVSHLNALVYAKQQAWLARHSPFLSEVPSFTLIQGFSRNNDFSPLMSAGRRGDIDFCIDEEDEDRLKSVFEKMGLRQRAYVGGRLVDLDQYEARSLSQKMGYAYSKDMAYSTSEPFEFEADEEFEFGEAFGALRNFDNRLEIAYVLERTISFGDNDRAISIEARNKRQYLGVTSGDDHLLALAAALRFARGTPKGEHRLRPAVEFIWALASPEFQVDSTEFLRLARKHQLVDVVASAVGTLALLHPSVDDLLRSRALPRTNDPVLQESLHKQIMAV